MKRGGPRSVAFALDADGVAVRALPTRTAALNWLRKHRPELGAEAAGESVRVVHTGKEGREFYLDQIAKGCSDRDVISFMLYCDGTATAWRLDFKRGRVNPVRRTDEPRNRIIKA